MITDSHEPADAAAQPPETAEQREPPDLRFWRKQIQRAKRCDRDAFKTIARLRRYYAGKGKKQPETLDDVDKGDEPTVRANLIYSTMQALFPRLYARNPEIAVSVADSVSSMQAELVRNFARTLEIVTNRQIREAGIKRQGKRQLRSGMITRVGWLKASYQRDYAADPLIANRMNDAQDNIARLRSLIAECERDGIDSSEHERKYAELEEAVETLQQQPEVVVAEGMVIDRVLTDDILVDPDVREIEDYLQGQWMAHGAWITDDEARVKYGLTDDEVKQATRYRNRNPTEHDEDGHGTATSGAHADDSVGLLRAWEIWDRRANRVRTWIEGMRRWAKPAFVPARQGRRWYPFFGLILNPLDGERWPQSDVELLEKLQDEYNETREKFAKHRDSIVPATAARKGDLTEDDVKKLQSRTVGELLLLDGPDDPNAPLANSIAEVNQARIDPAAYDTAATRADFDLVSGASDAARGSVVRAKTATEAEYLEQGLGERTEERRDTIEDLTSDIATFAAEVLLQELTPEQVRRIAGPDAVWPELPREEIYDLVQIEVRAGSTGRPNKTKEREAWREFLPLLLQAVQQIAQYRMSGAEELANAQVEVLRETLRRLDERVDVERFLPLTPAMQPGVPGMPAAPMPGAPQPGAMPFQPAPMNAGAAAASAAPVPPPPTVQ